MGCVHSDPILPLHLPEDVGLEDPHLYRDARGGFHALFHAFSLNASTADGDFGGHAFSEDGWNWTWSGLSYNNRGTFSDGTSFKEGSASPLGLTNGVIYKDASTEGYDACFTFVQPVRT